jgi:hypothetical protein
VILSVVVALTLVGLRKAKADTTSMRSVALSVYTGVSVGQLLTGVYNEFLARPLL